MATVKFVPKEHREILEKYTPSNGVIWVFDEESQQLLSENGINNGDDVEHNFECDSDIEIDIVRNPDHYFMTENT